MKSGLGISLTMTLLLPILAQIAAQIRTWYNDNTAITFFYQMFCCWKVSYFAPLGESSQEKVLLQNNSIGKSIKLIPGASEVQGEPCCNAYNKWDMKILSTLLHGQLGLIMPLAGSLRTVGAPVHVFFRSRRVDLDCENQWKMMIVDGHIESSVVISKHG